MLSRNGSLMVSMACAAALAGCFGVDYRNQQVACSEGDCPSGQTCGTDDVCYDDDKIPACRIPGSIEPCGDADAGVDDGDAGKDCVPEVCDGKDNDCDGETDEDWPLVGDACSDGVGGCMVSGVVACSSDGASASCNAIATEPAGIEVCENDVDETCDGSLVDGCDCTPGDSDTCGPASETGECKFGAVTCGSNSKWSTCQGAVQPTTELCNGRDDSCSGTADDGFNVGDTCTDGSGLCGDDSATYSCAANATSTECKGTPDLGSTLCYGDVLATCDLQGNETSSVSCPLGCGSGACFDILASNGMSAYFGASGDVNFDVYYEIDTGDPANGGDDVVVTRNGTTINLSHSFQTAPDSSGVDLVIFPVGSLTISGTLKVIGRRGLVFVSEGDVLLDSGADVTLYSGYHNSPSCGGGSSTYDASGPYPGPGGGGFGAAGGKGGDQGGAAGGAGGAVSGNASLVPLRGGCSGGYWDGLQPEGSRGGGAIQIVSRTKITLSGDAVINAPGQGGGAGPPDGAGSGGGILLEAPSVHLGLSVTDTAVLAANGGSGASTVNGESGQASTAAAQGGGGGGDGGSVLSPTGKAGAAGDASTVGGSGGGGVGRIRINTLGGSGYVKSDNAVISPNPSLGSLGTQ